MTRQAFISYAKYWTDSAKMQSLTDYQIDAGFTVEGFEHIEDAWSEGPGPILALPHLGGWEWAGRWLTCRPKFEVTVVVEFCESRKDTSGRYNNYSSTGF